MRCANDLVSAKLPRALQPLSSYPGQASSATVVRVLWLHWSRQYVFCGQTKGDAARMRHDTGLAGGSRT